jgi:transcriptional regulator with XRE-family HTH domain
MAPKAGTKPTPRGHNVIGGRIRQARVKHKPPLSQRELAAKLGVQGLDLDRPTITRIENQQRFLRDYEIRVIARTLKVSVAWLFGE